MGTRSGRQANQGCVLDLDVAPEREYDDPRRRCDRDCEERRSRCDTLGNVREQDEQRNREDAAADSEERGEDPRRESDGDEAHRRIVRV